MKFLFMLWLAVCLPACTPMPVSNESRVVYVTQSGNRYHLENCRYLAKSAIKTTVAEATENGYTSCAYCLSDSNSKTE